MKVYNKVFSFLLQVKRAKYCLDELCFEGKWHHDEIIFILKKKIFILLQVIIANNFQRNLLLTDLEKEPLVPKNDGDDLGYLDLTLRSPDKTITKQQLVHKMQLFRMKLLHFVNSLNNYIMTRVSSAFYFLRFKWQ